MTATALPPAPVRSTDATRLAALLKQADCGDDVDLHELSELTKSRDRSAAGLAKRLLAILLMRAAQRDACGLLAEACKDLDYRYPVVLNEAVAHAAELKQTDAVVDLRLCAAAAHARRGEHVPALVQLINAVSEDFRNGAKHANTPDSIRRMVEVYERVARETQRAMGITTAVRGRRRSPEDGKLRLAHVVAQLVDGGHSTSRAVDTMLWHADRARFDVYLFVTEALAAHEQHAEQAFGSNWSDHRAPNRIAAYQRELGVPVVLPQSRTSCLTAAAELHRRMAELQIDVAFFHGSLATPTDWMLCAWQAAPWQSDRGFGIPLHCPQVDYQFFEFAGTMERLAFLCRERGIPHGPLRYGGADLSHVVTAQPLPRELLNVPADHVLLATVGNHLPKRMSDAFCRTVAGVLRAHPKTTYLVIGPGTFETQRAIFADLAGPTPKQGRVRFIGNSSITERVAQTIDIYLNEYPNGGGVAVGEAMAAGKAVLCMQAGDSSLSMAGAFYVGAEHLVQPATDEAYAARLARLIVDPAERARSGMSLKARYHSEFDGRKLTQDETERIWQVVHELPPVGIA